MTSSIVYNLLPGQYQLENVVFGNGTTVPVTHFDPKAYDVNGQDFQTTWADEVRFGRDTLKPNLVELSFIVLNNEMLPGHESEMPNFWKDMPKVDDFRRIWRFDQGRKVSGSMMPFYYGSKDKDQNGNHITKVFFGRPGQITIEKDDQPAGGTQCLAQFRLTDTLSYRNVEYFQQIDQQEDPVFIYRDPEWDGQADSALRIVATGPLTNPKFTVGDKTIQIQTSLEEGEVMEISSYPWLRRVVNNNRENLSADIVGASQYLDQLRIPAGVPVPVRWTSDEVNTFIPFLGNAQWQEDIEGMTTGLFHDLPLPQFNTIEGKVIVQGVINFLTNDWYRKVLTASFGTGRAACIYTDQKFGSDFQRIRFQVAAEFWGQSCVVIKSNSSMDNFLAIEVQSHVGRVNSTTWDTTTGNFIRIRAGHSPDVTTVKAEWENTSLLGWTNEDYIEFEFNPSNNKATAFYNGHEVASWIDASNEIHTGVNNRYTGFIFNLFESPLDVGTGIRNILAYDRATVPTPMGSVYLLWRDAWMGIQ